jgi:hypothetical protein
MAEFTREKAKTLEVYQRQLLASGENRYVRLPFNLVTYDDSSGQYIQPVPLILPNGQTFYDMNSDAQTAGSMTVDVVRSRVSPRRHPERHSPEWDSVFTRHHTPVEHRHRLGDQRRLGELARPRATLNAGKPAASRTGTRPRGLTPRLSCLQRLCGTSRACAG